MALLANESWTHGDFFQLKKLKTVEDGSCRVVERASCVRPLVLATRRRGDFREREVPGMRLEDSWKGCLFGQEVRLFRGSCRGG